LKELYLEKDDPLQTTDDEFQDIYEIIKEYVLPLTFVEIHKIAKRRGGVTSALFCHLKSGS
jgi:hypothetical protein